MPHSGTNAATSQFAQVVADVKDLRDQLKAQTLEREFYEKYRQVLEELQQLRLEVKEGWIVFKVASTVIAVTLTVLGAVGWGTWKDVKGHMDQQISQEIERKRVFYDNLIAGTALLSQRSDAGAKVHLLACFHDHEFDNSVLYPLLVSINRTDDWQKADMVLHEIRMDQEKFEAIKDAAIYTVVGAILVQSGVSRALQDPKSQVGTASMKDGLGILEKAIELAKSPISGPKDTHTLIRAYYNCWLYYVAKGDFAKARSFIDLTKEMNPDEAVYEWTVIENWRCVRDLKGVHPDYIGKARAQWEELGKRARLS